jgi:uncharacterized protein (DUF2141 family)
MAKTLKSWLAIGSVSRLNLGLGVGLAMGLAVGLGDWNGASHAQAQGKGRLTVEIDGLRNRRGQVCLRLYSGSRGFPDGSQNVVQQRCVKLSGDPLAVTFGNLTAGSYAVAVIHDANGDNKANRNGLGIPTEGFGFSGNPVIRTGAPKFGEAAILVAGPNTNIQIQMRYLFGG